MFHSIHISYPRITTFNEVKRLQLLSIAVALFIAGFSFLNYSVLEYLDNTFARVGSFADDRDCGGLFLYKINTVIKPT